MMDGSDGSGEGTVQNPRPTLTEFAEALGMELPPFRRDILAVFERGNHLGFDAKGRLVEVEGPWPGRSEGKGVGVDVDGR